MKKPLLLFACFFALVAHAQKSDSTQQLGNRHFIFKAYPTSLLVSQLMPYCSDIQFGLEYIVTKHHSVYAITTASVPHILCTPAISIFNIEPYIFYGGKFILGYRYYINGRSGKPLGFYVGAEVSISGYISHKRSDQFNEDTHGFGNNYTSDFRAHAIMSNYNFTLGYHKVKHRFKKRWKHPRDLSFDIGFSVGYRYHYFWRHYQEGNLQYFRNGGLYNYYKTSPIGGSINISFGGFF